jgi:hypothetical protein
MKKKGKTILVIAGVLLLLLLCCGASVAAGVWGFSKLMEESMQVKNELLHTVCSGGELSEEDYDKYFTQSFRNDNTYEEAKELVSEAFPESYDCANLQGNLLKMLQNAQSLNIENGVVTFSYRVDSETYEIVLEMDEGSYRIEDINT